MLKRLFLGYCERLLLTFPRYKQFGTKLSPIFGFAKSSRYKTIFKLSLMPKLLVACVLVAQLEQIYKKKLAKK